ncbi:MAG TPA: hypothetical protein VN673_05300, partial [Clostridia bacterium]|nr:hypothetical protein [Clostridia bacterium]
MKPSEKLKDLDFELQFEALLCELLGRVPFLKLVSLKKDAKISPKLTDRPDRLAQVAAGERKWTLVVEEKRLGQPREVRTAALQLERYLKHLPADVPRYGVLLAPFISEESAKICAEAG